LSSCCCYRITANLRAESPLHIGNGRRTGIIKHTLPFIPGSFIRGSIGDFLRKISGSEQSKGAAATAAATATATGTNLYSLFFLRDSDSSESTSSSDIFFKHCYPLHFKCRSLTNANAVFVPASKTLFRCRNRQCGTIYDTFKPPLRCKICDKSVKPLTGFVCRNCGEIEPQPVSIKRLSAVAIDRHNHTAAAAESLMVSQTVSGNDIGESGENADEDENDTINNDGHGKGTKTGNWKSEEKHGLLHTAEVIERGAEFGLEIVLSSSTRSSTLDQLTKLLTRSLEDDGIGASKSRGLGKIKVKDLRIEKITPETIEERAIGLIPNASDTFSVQLISPIINDTTESSLEPSTLLEGARRAYSWCFKEGKPSLPEICRINEKYSYDIFGGWSLKEERLRRNAVSIVSGSAFLFKIQQMDKERVSLLSRSLACLEYYAIGGYKSHGYGQIRIAPYYTED
jgi:CRISPR/Cas system CSM-associated protein Csm3 (group 7 of RAMP superfamily)